jgi:hypothetical protein
MYYLERRTQREIAVRLAVSGSQVSRLLYEAVSRGVAGIDVDGDFAIDGVLDQTLSRAIRDRFCLHDAAIVDTPKDVGPVVANPQRDRVTICALGNYAGSYLRANLSGLDHDPFEALLRAYSNFIGQARSANGLNSGSLEPADSMPIYLLPTWALSGVDHL